MENAISVDLPLKGEWVALNTPARRIPSHGTDFFGQRYAFDFVRTDYKPGIRMFKGSNLKYYTVGVPTHDAFCWKKEVYSPFEAEVVVARDDFKEPGRLHPVRDILRVLNNAFLINLEAALSRGQKINLQRLSGNYVIIKSDRIFALFAHLHPGSLRVKEGQKIKSGDLIGLVGHTGNSTAPHLHFQIMDLSDPLKARGLPCCFKAYEVLKDGVWQRVDNGVPGFNERFRSVQ